MKIFTDKRLLACGLVGGTLSRHSGNMQAPSAQEAVYRELNISPKHILHFHQTHSTTIVPIASQQTAQAYAASPLQDADAWVLAPFPTGWGAAIITADCVPLFLWDESGSAAALAHCGWRGVVQGLPGKTAQALIQKNRAPLYAWLGPHIQACCFEVQQDVATQFAPDCLSYKNGKIFVNLNTAIKHQLLTAGLQEKNISMPHYCTCGDQENFFSWRRDHQRNLLLSFIYKP